MVAKNKIFEEKVMTFKGQLKKSELSLNWVEVRSREPGETTRKKSGQQSQMVQIWVEWASKALHWIFWSGGHRWHLIEPFFFQYADKIQK